jgi:hypothetical protein
VQVRDTPTALQHARLLHHNTLTAARCRAEHWLVRQADGVVLAAAAMAYGGALGDAVPLSAACLKHEARRLAVLGARRGQMGQGRGQRQRQGQGQECCRCK